MRVKRRPYLLFSSVGDSHDQAVLEWSRRRRLGAARDYDIALVYYGRCPTRFATLAAHADRLYWTPGSKFQNLIRHLDAIAALDYRYTWVVDDDIALDPGRINRLFRITEQHGLAAAQPSLSPSGAYSYPTLLRRSRNTLLRHVNFVEVGCPVLSSQTLRQLLTVIEPHIDLLTCWGIDILLSQHVFRPDAPFAVIDAITVRNPHPHEKRSGRRECERGAGSLSPRDRWLQVRERLGADAPPVEIVIEEYGQRRRWGWRRLTSGG
jgi:hypothetical protein